MTAETNLPKIIRARNEPGTIVTHFDIRGHKIACDEMPLYGGHDEAPDPWDLIIAGAGGCSAVTLRQYAEKKGWDIGEITFKMIYDSIDGEDVVRKEISFSGPLSDEQRAVLLRVANCGAEKMLARGMKFINVLAE
jgi:putative redox protein